MVLGSRYLGAYFGPAEEMDAWVLLQVWMFSEGVRDQAKVAKQHPLAAYDVLGILLQLVWQYIQRTVPGVGSLMDTNESAVREDFSQPSLEGRR